MNKYQPPLPYIATIKPVREVSLTGWADLLFWHERLAAEGLLPVDFSGRAQVLISSIEARFMGLKFRELIVVVTVEPDGWPALKHGAYLVHAFHSSRLLGWCERNMFATPYYFGQIENSVGPPAHIELREESQVSLRVAMDSSASINSRSPERAGAESWAGPIFLPSRPGASVDQRSVFFADIHGETQTYPFEPEHDTFLVERSSKWPVFEWLKESQFSGCEWSLRPTATHSRTKTVRRKASELSA